MNFREELDDEIFRTSLLNTLIYVLIVVPGTVGFGLLVALLIEKGKVRSLMLDGIALTP